MKKAILMSCVLLVGGIAQANELLACGDGQNQIVSCSSSTSEDVFIQEIIVCQDQNDYLVDMINWRGEATGLIPVQASFRTGASTYQAGDAEVQVKLVVSSSPSRKDGKIVRAGSLKITDAERSQTIKMDCSR